MNKKLLCCICGNEIKKEGCSNYIGNNPNGAMWKNESGQICEPTFNNDARCCDECNSRYVIPGRLFKLKQMRGAN